MDNSNVFSEIWDTYKSTILHSIITSFGLDFIVHDQNGGDVDTINNIRNDGLFKSARNASAYANRGEYDSLAYHGGNDYYKQVKHDAKSQFGIHDAYVPNNTVYYGKASFLKNNPSKQASLDHIISAKEIHDDPARVIAGLDGPELANQDYNYAFTNASLNSSMGDKSIPDYIRWRAERGNPVSPEEADRLLGKDSEARNVYNDKINRAYYTSENFIKDVATAATKRGIEMGIRQALGFVFLEIWFACEEEVKALPSGISFNECTQAIITGIQKGVDNAKTKYKEILKQFAQGFLAGALASITTTLINAFITTDKNAVRYIRQVYTIVVQTGTILIINPDGLLLGDQLKDATITLVTGASILVGTAVGNQIENTPIGQDKTVGDILIRFISSLVSGLLSCTLLVLIDRSKLMDAIVSKLNTYESIDHDLRKTANTYILLAAEFANYDIDEFNNEINNFSAICNRLQETNDDELNEILLEAFEENDISLPWYGDFDSFMGNSLNVLDFD